MKALWRFIQAIFLIVVVGYSGLSSMAWALVTMMCANPVNEWDVWRILLTSSITVTFAVIGAIKIYEEWGKPRDHYRIKE